MASTDSGELTIYLANALEPEKKHELKVSRKDLTRKFLQTQAKALLKCPVTAVFFPDGDEVVDKVLVGHSVREGDCFYVSDGQKLNTSHDVIHLVMLGSGAVGKSALTLQFIQNQFVEDYDPTIEDAYQKSVNIDGSTVLVDILDTAGQEDFAALRTSWMRDKDGIVLVYSIVNQESLETLTTFYDQLCEVYEDNCPPIIVVGNKSDLADSRQVEKTDAIDTARKWHAAEYLETSALLGENVTTMYGALVRHILAPRIREQAEASDEDDDKKWYSRCTLL